jgi:hypothetical protein
MLFYAENILLILMFLKQMAQKYKNILACGTENIISKDLSRFEK